MMLEGPTSPPGLLLLAGAENSSIALGNIVINPAPQIPSVFQVHSLILTRSLRLLLQFVFVLPWI